MKKLRSRSHTRAVQGACTVSAAALMLGVSQAATIGFNFQTHYCNAASYSGSPVTAPAFGVGTNSWESLTPMDTGYGCSPDYYTLTQDIDTTTDADGLNPLPNGALTVTWSAYTANVSGFGGYGRNPPNYVFGGNGYRPGEEQVYWGFLRDGLNFGPGSSGGDNNKPGYVIDITGLKSVFTNSPFVVQLIASSDSLQGLTNAFVVDATLNSTQSVTYPNIAPINNLGATRGWLRGIGGGISTGSGAVNTDHLIIAGNQAAHVAPDPDNGEPGYNLASTIAGFIVTDKPVVTMSPQSAVTLPHDNLTLRAIAIGVPPVSYQWRKDGVAIPGATDLSLSLKDVALVNGGVYDLVCSNAYGTATSKPSTVIVDHLVSDSSVTFALDASTAAAHDAQNHGAAYLASAKDGAGVSRSGVLKFTGTKSEQLVLTQASGTTDFDSPQGTIAFWFQSAGVTDPNGHPAMLVDHRTSTGVVLAQNPDGTLFVQTAPASANSFSSQGSLADSKWHHVALVYDQTDGGAISLYIDGVLDTQNANVASWAWVEGQSIEVGLSHDSYWQPFVGLLSDFRVYNQPLSVTQIGTIVASGDVGDAGSLVSWIRLDKAPVPGISLSWHSPTAVLQSADSIAGPFADVADAPTSPYIVRADKGVKYYRYSDTHTPTDVVSNPYDM